MPFTFFQTKLKSLIKLKPPNTPKVQKSSYYIKIYKNIRKDEVV